MCAHLWCAPEPVVLLCQALAKCGHNRCIATSSVPAYLLSSCFLEHAVLHAHSAGHRAFTCLSPLYLPPSQSCASADSFAMLPELCCMPRLLHAPWRVPRVITLHSSAHIVCVSVASDASRCACSTSSALASARTSAACPSPTRATTTAGSAPATAATTTAAAASAAAPRPPT